jgi:hypothetical protein
MQGRSKNSFLDSTPDKCLHGGFYGSSAVVLGDLWLRACDYVVVGFFSF